MIYKPHFWGKLIDQSEEKEKKKGDMSSWKKILKHETKNRNEKVVCGTSELFCAALLLLKNNRGNLYFNPVF